MKKIIKIIILFILIIINIFPLKSLARYYRKISDIKCCFEIAEPIIIVENQDTIINENVQIEEFYFSIKNYNEIKVSEIDFLYEIEIKKSNENFPVKYELYDCSSSEELLNGKNKVVSKINKNKKINKKYKLVIILDDKSNYSIATDIDIIITVTQTM